MENQNKNLGFGLQELPQDGRDFKLGAFLGRIDVPDEDFIVAEPLEIKDQYASDMCGAFAGSAVSEDQEREILSAEFLFAKAKQISGDIESWGLNLRTVCKALVKYGSIRKANAVYSLENKDRDFLADHKNWPVDLDMQSVLYRKSSYFAVDYGKDTFTNMRIALWQNKEKRCSILTGTVWQEEWNYAEGGIIPKEMGTKSFGHAIKIFGQKKINGEIYLMAQLSNSKTIGDNGIFYFPKEIVNSEFTFGAYCFLDVNPNEVKKEIWPLWRIILETIKKIFK